MAAVFHPHADTTVQRESQIEHLLELTDPALVNLCLDVGHRHCLEPAIPARAQAHAGIGPEPDGLAVLKADKPRLALAIATASDYCSL